MRRRRACRFPRLAQGPVIGDDGALARRGAFCRATDSIRRRAHGNRGPPAVLFAGEHDIVPPVAVRAVAA
jgi:hypothetical protein